MAITATTLSAAIDTNDMTLTVASATGFTAGSTICLIDDEILEVKSVNGTNIGVTRGMTGTRATNHGNGRAVQVGAPGDFETVGVFFNNGQTTRFFGGPALPSTFIATTNTASAQTLTAGQVAGGIVFDDPNGGAQTLTLPTAALLVAAIPGVQVGSTLRLAVRNTADANETVTVAAGTGGTTSGTMTIAQNAQKEFLIRFTGVALGSEAYIVYSMGSTTF